MLMGIITLTIKIEKKNDLYFKSEKIICFASFYFEIQGISSQTVKRRMDRYFWYSMGLIFKKIIPKTVSSKLFKKLNY